MNSFGRFLAITFVFCATCSAVTIKQNYDRNADFGSYKTYAWAPSPKTQAAISPAIDKAIRDAVEKSLSADGLTKVEGKKPDVYVIYHVTSGQEEKTRYYTDWGFGTGFRPGYGFYVGWPGRPTTYAEIDQFKVGALVLDFVEVRREQLVWRGAASSVLGPEEQSGTKAAKAVHSMLLRFPPPVAPPKR